MKLEADWPLVRLKRRKRQFGKRPICGHPNTIFVEHFLNLAVVIHCSPVEGLFGLRKAEMLQSRKMVWLAFVGISLGSVSFSGLTAQAKNQSVREKVCFKNETEQEIYFKAVFGPVSAGGSKTQPGGKFCVHKSEAMMVRVSRGRRTDTLCTGEAQPGHTLALTALSDTNSCRWRQFSHRDR